MPRPLPSYPQIHQLAWATLLLLTLALTIWIYWPGLKGGFLLDDIPNLSALGEGPTLEAKQRATQFVLSGRAGPLGRPVALASFLINDNYWPTQAAPFKYTNLLLHLITGLLVFWLVWLVCRHAAHWPSWCHSFVPWAVAATWLLHPLNVSTVLYVIQRMTILSTLFMLVGMIVYLKGRLTGQASLAGRYAWMTGGLVFGVGLGILCKETAINLPLYVLALEFTLLSAWCQSCPRPRGWTIWSVPMLVSPIVAVVGWQALRFDSMLRSYETRPFNMAERLWTEPRALFDYLHGILVPQRAGTGLFHDDFVVSQSLTEPVTTLLAIVVLAIFLVAALRLRLRLPLFSFAVLWFMAGHLFEAGPWPLELYFEHRNYLPMIGPLLAVIVGLTRLPGAIRRFGTASVAALIALAGFTTWLNTSLWGDPVLLPETWAEEHPGSRRAQQFSADHWSRRGRYDLAERRLRGLLERDPRATSAYAAIVQLNCLQRKDFAGSEFPWILNGLQQGTRDPAAPATLQTILRMMERGGCPELEYDHVDRMVSALLENPSFRHNHLLGNLYYIRANIGIAERNFGKAAMAVKRALKHHPGVDLALMQASLYASAEMYDEALKSLDLAANLDKSRVFGTSVKQDAIRDVRNNVLEARDKRPK